MTDLQFQPLTVSSSQHYVPSYLPGSRSLLCRFASCTKKAAAALLSRPCKLHIRVVFVEISRSIGTCDCLGLEVCGSATDQKSPLKDTNHLSRSLHPIPMTGTTAARCKCEVSIVIGVTAIGAGIADLYLNRWANFY